MNKLLDLLTDAYVYFKRYRIVAYNNRTYSGFRHVNEQVYTILGAKMWLSENADRTRYVYDLYDIRKKSLVYDYTGMFDDFESVKKLILKTNANYEDAMRKLIFNFKLKWTPKAGDQAASIYFADLMSIFRAHMEQFNTESSVSSHKA
jgi:hypothetical protein